MHLKNINKSFKIPSSDKSNKTKEQIEILKDFNLEINSAELIAIIGPSGSGKSTLLNIMGLLDSPDSGSVIFEGKELTSFSQRKRTLWRRSNLGFIFQFHNLLPEFTAAENVALAPRIAGLNTSNAIKKACQLLNKLGLEGKEHKLPQQLSGGEQQRVAIARAMVNKPRFILADEPTGNLDHDNGLLVFEMLQNCVVEFGITVVMVTHNQELADKATRKVSLG